MRNVQNVCATETTDSNIKFEERRSAIVFQNPLRLAFKKVQVDGCVLKDGLKCDHLLCSSDELEERFVELKGSDVSHAIAQLRTTIQKLGEHDDNRHAYIVCTKVAPKISTEIQKAKKEFKDKFNSDLVIKETPLKVKLN